jgi:DNA processing protein
VKIFPSRNRIVAGMCDATIVIESGVKGGALITADIANSYNRDVFAFPSCQRRILHWMQ